MDVGKKFYGMNRWYISKGGTTKYYYDKYTFYRDVYNSIRDLKLTDHELSKIKNVCKNIF